MTTVAIALLLGVTAMGLAAPSHACTGSATCPSLQELSLLQALREEFDDLCKGDKAAGTDRHSR
jgi:hypothetical protein